MKNFKKSNLLTTFFLIIISTNYNKTTLCMESQKKEFSLENDKAHKGSENIENKPEIVLTQKLKNHKKIEFNSSSASSDKIKISPDAVQIFIDNELDLEKIDLESLSQSNIESLIIEKCKNLNKKFLTNLPRSLVHLYIKTKLYEKFSKKHVTVFEMNNVSCDSKAKQNNIKEILETFKLENNQTLYGHELEFMLMKYAKISSFKDKGEDKSKYEDEGMTNFKIIAHLKHKYSEIVKSIPEVFQDLIFPIIKNKPENL